MGVHGLWQLLQSAGQPVTLESLEGKVLAVDVSIWLNKAAKGMRDKFGNAVYNAHLILIFHRICKLLFYNIKPIFVFDGGVPELKKRTIAARRERKINAKGMASKTTEKMMQNYLKGKALETVTGQRGPRLGKIQKSSQQDIFDLPPVPATIQADSSSEDEVVDAETQWMTSMRSEDVERMLENIGSVDFESEEFKALPPEIQHELLTAMKDSYRRRYNKRKSQPMPEEAHDFSDFQLKNLFRRGKITKTIYDVRKTMNSRSSGEIAELDEDEFFGKSAKTIEAKRVASEDRQHYILMKKSGKKGGENVLFNTNLEIDKIDIYRETKRKENFERLERDPAQFKESVIDNWTGMSFVSDSSEDSDFDYDAEISFRASYDSKIDTINRKLEMIENEESIRMKNVDRPSFGLGEKIGHVADVNDSNSVISESEEKPVAVASTLDTKRDELQLIFSLVDEKSRDVNEDESSDDLTILQENKKNTEFNETTKQEIIDPIIELESKTNLVSDKVSSVEIEPDFAEKPDSSESHQNILQNDENNHIKQSEKHEIITEQTKHEIIHPKTEQETIDISSVTGYVSNVVESSCLSKPDSSPQNTPEVDSENVMEVSLIDDVNMQAESSGSVGNSDVYLKEPPSTEVMITNDQMDKIQSDEEEVSAVPKPDENFLDLTAPEENIDNENVRRFRQDVQGQSVEQLSVIQDSINEEQERLGRERKRQERTAASVGNEEYKDVQELLRLFGIPFIISPMEAEAQCAILDLTNQTEGSVTDDSDIFLFGGKRVFKNIFNQEKYAELYTSENINQLLYLDREKMIALAFLTGSDYTEGVHGVGSITAMEILQEFGGDALQPLINLRNWYDEIKNDENITYIKQRTKLKNKLLTVELPRSFPNHQVWEAYVNPTVDWSEEPFEWAKPDLPSIRLFAKERLGWTNSRTDEILLPVMHNVNSRGHQSSITKYFSPNMTSPGKTVESKRLKRVVNLMRTETQPDGADFLHSADDVQEAPRSLKTAPAPVRKKAKMPVILPKISTTKRRIPTAQEFQKRVERSRAGSRGRARRPRMPFSARASRLPIKQDAASNLQLSGSSSDSEVDEEN